MGSTPLKALGVSTTRKQCPNWQNMSVSRRDKWEKIDRKLTDFCHFGQIIANSDIICQLSVTLDNFVSIVLSFITSQFGHCFLVVKPSLPLQVIGQIRELNGASDLSRRLDILFPYAISIVTNTTNTQQCPHSLANFLTTSLITLWHIVYVSLARFLQNVR